MASFKKKTHNTNCFQIWPTPLLVYISLCQEEKETRSHNDRFYSPFDESEEIQCADFRVRVWLFLIGRYIVALFVESDLLISTKYIFFY